MSIPSPFQGSFPRWEWLHKSLWAVFPLHSLRKVLDAQMPTIFTPIILPSFQTSELLAEAAIILPKFLAETHNHQEKAQKHQENSTFFFFFKGKNLIWFSWERGEQSCVRKSTFNFVFFTSSGGENTSASGLWGGNAALRGGRINLLLHPWDLLFQPADVDSVTLEHRGNGWVIISLAWGHKTHLPP